MSELAVGNDRGWLFLELPGQPKTGVHAVRAEAACGTMPPRLVVEFHGDAGQVEAVARLLDLPVTQRSVSEHDPIRARVGQLEKDLAALGKAMEDERHHWTKVVEDAVKALQRAHDRD